MRDKARGGGAAAGQTYSGADFGIGRVILNQVVVEIAQLFGIARVESRVDGAQLVLVEKRVVPVLVAKGLELALVVARLVRLLTGENLFEPVHDVKGALAAASSSRYRLGRREKPDEV